MKTLKRDSSSDTQWVPISDLMSVLMMVFLFIAVIYMRHVQVGKQNIERIAVTYQKLQNDLYEDLDREFSDSLKVWNAEIEKSNLTFRFKEPDVLFDKGKSDLKVRFKQILDNFFPRYIAVVSQQKYRDDIEEIRIEGHTSSDWSVKIDGKVAYILNMELSQDRTRTVLQYVLDLQEIQNERNWLVSRLTANGLSSSKLIMNGALEDRVRSRRVEFRVRTNAEQRIVNILEER